MKERIRSWYEKVPKMERDIPIILFEGRIYTPNEVIREVERGTRLGKDLLSYMETEIFASPTLREWRIVGKKRALKWAEKLPEDFSIICFGGRIATKKDIKKMIVEEKETFAINTIDYEAKQALTLLRRV